MPAYPELYILSIERETNPVLQVSLACDRPHGPARLDEILPALLRVPSEERSANPVDLSMRLAVGMTRPWRRRSGPVEVDDVRESVEDRQIIKAVLVGAAALLFLLAVAGWL